MIWCCPRCKGRLEAECADLRCATCDQTYAQLDGIPDLRLHQNGEMDFADDLLVARELAAAKHLSLENLVRSVYARRPGWDHARIELRTSQVLRSPHRLVRETPGWLNPLLGQADLVLDLGCGAGMLMAAMHRHGFSGVGVDVSMTWLVVAKRLITEWGGTPVLAAAFGEALPLPDGAVDVVVSLDVIEHVTSPDLYLQQISRVTRSGGRVIMTTPNRYSLTAEPHVNVWGVGWLPRRWQAPFVRWRSGKTYLDTRLMGSQELSRRIRRNTGFHFRFVMPTIPEEEIARFSRLKAWLAARYNGLCRSRLLRPVFLLVGPFFRIEARKPK